MKIALDYDKTYSADPAGWSEFIIMMRGRGHDVRIVTARDDRFDFTEPLIGLARAGVRIIFTRGIAKKWFCAHFGEGFNPDVWIDDKPESILGNSESTPLDLSEWRINRPDKLPAPAVGEF